MQIPTDEHWHWHWHWHWKCPEGRGGTRCGGSAAC